MQVKLNTKKAGVSLITVLIFMVIATIAATATWKWISSEGFSSASRMLKREAYQSAMAGIENTRSWMTYHANDVGAIIRQYIDGGNKPINLDSRLGSLQRAGQNYHVWLTGVNVEGSTYKLKIYSAGEARNNTKHNEVAIFNVDGLYRVDIPQVRRIKVSDFDYNYFGGTTINHGDIFARSMLVNGDLKEGNPASIDSNFIVTGNFKVSGNSVAVHGTACIGGNMDADNGIVGNNFYVHGNLDNLKIRPLTANKGTQRINLGNSIYGNLYVNGNITKANGNQVIDGNMTLKGTWTTNMRGYDAGVRGDLCVEGNGQILFPNQDREFKASGNVWMESDYPLWTGGNDNYSKYNRIVIGARNKDVYIKTGRNDYSALRNANVFTETANEPFGVPTNEERKWGKAAGHGFAAGTKVDEVYTEVFKNKAEKPGLAYIYNWTSSNPLVALGPYTDQGNNLLVYKLNGEWFWDTWHDNSYKSINLSGSQVVGSPYCGRAQGGGGIWGPIGPGGGSTKDKARPSCGVTPWFKIDGNLKKPFPGSRPSDLPCAESVKTHCDEIWTPSDGCGTANFLVPDPLVTGISYFESYASKNHCSAASSSGGSFNFDQFSNCYTQALAYDQTHDDKRLYNKYLVVKVTNNIFQNPSGTLRGKFIFIIDRDFSGGINMKLPPTSGSDSYVFMYFKNGWREEIQTGNGGGEYNYFIYTKGDIKNVLFNQNILKGSVYAAVHDEATGVKKCAKVKNLTFNRGMEFNKEMVDDLTNSGVICKNDGSTCGGIFDGSSPILTSSGSSVDSDEGKDSLFISTAPQLSIHVESMYETKESQPQTTESQALQQSYVILPRVIYLPSDPYGELKDYYNVLSLNVPLNGNPVTKNDVVNYVNCSGPGSISTTGKLFNGSVLTQGVYKCEANPQNLNKKVPFWVVVGNSSRGDGEVSFETPYQSLAVNQTTPVPVNILVSPHSTELKVKVNCPAPPSSEWSYTKNTTLLDNTAPDGCTFKIPPSNENGVYKLFDVTTAGATSGRLTFTLKTGERYTLASPYYTDLVVSSIANINRVDLTSSEIENYCKSEDHTCPTQDYYYWPNCSYTGLWVEPEGGATAVVTNDLNESWAVSVGGSMGTIELADRSGGKCVVIIPEKTPNGDDNVLQKSAMEANGTYSLYASAKALARTLKVVFMGDVGSGNIPEVNYAKTSVSNAIPYQGIGLENARSISVFDGEEIALSIDSTNTNNKDFSYWQCSGPSCPNTDPIRSSFFDSFKVNDNETVVYVHFGDVDKHCFFDDFKKGDVACNNVDDEYCVDKCEAADDAVCVGAIGGSYTKAKWHLLSGKLGDIENKVEYISIKNARKTTRGVNNKNNKIKVISTVTAGINGTLKALLRMPQVTSSYGISSENIANSGFMLRSNETGTEYLMLNLYVNKSKHMEAQVCTDAGSCLNGELVRNGSPKSVSTASMVMMSATLNTQNQLVVTAFTNNNYNDTPDEYSYTFSLGRLTNSYANRAHEYVGFSLADPNFKLYGVGWESEDYKSECWQVPPTIKCSFAAKAQNGVIELGKEVVPWIGHSDWFDSKDCSPHYYYYNGSDAGSGCGSADERGLECSSNYYYFNADGQGLHGYGNDVKTAKVSLYCPSIDGNDEALWLQSAGRAHCGTFWTGNFTECTENYPTLLADVLLSPMSEDLTERTVVGTVNVNDRTRKNLRGATLNITLENPDKNEVELVLVSKHDFDNASDVTMWGDRGTDGIYMSNAVKITGNSASFDVVEDLANGAEGFDPENVRSIILQNHGSTPVTVTLVSASCKNAVSVASCKAEYKEENNLNAWIVTAHVNNANSASNLTLNKKIESIDVNYECTGVTCVKESDVVTYTIADNPYVHQGEHYYFKMSASNGGVTDTKDCEVTPDPISAIRSECDVDIPSVQTGSGSVPQFQFTLYGCPKAGCKYKIQLGNSDLENGTAQSGEQIKKTFDNLNPEGGDALAVGQYTYKVIQDGSEAPFPECTATFNVTEQKSEEEEIATTCSIEGANNNSLSAGSQANFTFVVNNNQNINISGRNYQLVLPDGNIISGSTGFNQSKTQAFTVPAVSGDVILKVWDKTEYKESCKQSLTVSGLDIRCGVSRYNWDISGENTFYTSQELYFMAKNNANVAGEITVSVLKNGVADGTGTIRNYSQWNSTKYIGKLDAGEYTYKLQYGGADICTHTITVANPLTCSVNAETIGLGDAFTLTTSYGGNCWNSTLSGSPSGSGVSQPQNCQSSYSITPTKKGEFTYTYSVTNGSLGGASCTQTVTVSEVPPDITCPDNKTATVNSTVYVSPKSLVGCSEGCSYSIETGPTGSLTQVAGVLSGYAGGTVSFTGNSSEGDVEYVFRVGNNKGSDTCHFHINYTTAPSCVASDWIIDQYNNNKNITGSFTDGCFDFNTEKACSHAQVQNSASTGSGKFKINGTEINCGTYFDDNITASPVINLEVPSTCTVTGIAVSNCNSVASSSSAESSSSEANSSASGGTTIANNVSDFTVPSGTNVCFSNHPVPNDWQTQAHLKCDPGNHENGHVAIDDVDGGHGWGTIEITVDLDANKKYTGCHVVSRRDGNNVTCHFGW